MDFGGNTAWSISLAVWLWISFQSSLCFRVFHYNAQTMFKEVIVKLETRAVSFEHVLPE